jgi:hypothetical protein
MQRTSNGHMKRPFLLPLLQVLRRHRPVTCQLPFPPILEPRTCAKALWYCASFIFGRSAPVDDDYVLQTSSRKSTSRPVDPAHAHAPSKSFNDSRVLGLANRTSTKSEPMDIDPPTLDLRALSLNRAPGSSKASSHLLLRRTTTSRPPSLPPPASVVISEEDDMEDLYGPPLGLSSSYAPPSPSPRKLPREPSPSLQYPEVPRVLPALATEVPHRLGTVKQREPREVSPVLRYPAEPRVLPALAAEDPDILGVLERHERREAARPRQGMRKAKPVHRAGKRRGGFVLVADRTGAEAALAERAGGGEPRGVFASYFARSGI